MGPNGEIFCVAATDGRTLGHTCLTAGFAGSSIDFVWRYPLALALIPLQK